MAVAQLDNENYPCDAALQHRLTRIGQESESQFIIISVD